VPNRDQLAEVSRLEALGAKRINIGQATPSSVVMADPEGNDVWMIGEPGIHIRFKSVEARLPVGCLYTEQSSLHGSSFDGVRLVLGRWGALPVRTFRRPFVSPM